MSRGIQNKSVVNDRLYSTCNNTIVLEGVVFLELLHLQCSGISPLGVPILEQCQTKLVMSGQLIQLQFDLLNLSKELLLSLCQGPELLPSINFKESFLSGI